MEKKLKEKTRKRGAAAEFGMRIFLPRDVFIMGESLKFKEYCNRTASLLNILVEFLQTFSFTRKHRP